MLTLSDEQQKKVDNYVKNVVQPFYADKKIINIKAKINDITSILSYLNTYPSFHVMKNKSLEEFVQQLEDNITSLEEDLHYYNNIKNTGISIEGKSYYIVEFCGIGTGITYVWEWNDEKLELDITEYDKW